MASSVLLVHTHRRVDRMSALVPGRRSVRRAARLLALVITTGLVSSSPVSATDSTPPELLAIELSTSAVSVEGLDTELVTVSVHLTDPEGVFSTRPAYAYPSPAVTLRRTDGSDPLIVKKLTRTSGTAQDGIWVAEFHVASTHEGTWRVIHVSARDLHFNGFSVDPETLGFLRTFDVTGTHQPQLRFWFRPRPGIVGRPMSLRGRLTDSDTGLPIADQVLLVGQDDRRRVGCFRDPIGGLRVLTDDNGYFRAPVQPVNRRTTATCAFLVSPVPPAPATTVISRDVTIIESHQGRPIMQAVVTARPTRDTVRLGGRIPIDGEVRPETFSRIHLQRLTQRGWRTESSRYVSFAPYALFAEPPFRGSHRYRVLLPSRPGRIVGDVSPVMVLTAT
jgi:hypothetical protein